MQLFWMKVVLPQDAVVFNNIDLGVGTDWQKEVLRTDAPIVVNNISARGGSETVSYF